MESGLRLLRCKRELNRCYVNRQSIQQYACRATSCCGKAIISTARPAGAESVHIRAGTTGSRAGWSVSARQALLWCRADDRLIDAIHEQQTALEQSMTAFLTGSGRCAGHIEGMEKLIVLAVLTSIVVFVATYALSAWSEHR
jgi:hypothetical protein